MTRQGVLILFAGLLFVAFFVNKVYAHSGHKKPAMKMEEPAVDAIDNILSKYYSLDKARTDAIKNLLELERDGSISERGAEFLEGLREVDNLNYAPLSRDTSYAIDSPYAVDGGEPSTGEEGDFSLSRSDIFTDEPPMTSGAMEHMDHQPSGGMDHKMPEIEIAKREWVSPKQKGYGAAVGITIFAGLIFGALSFKRPLE